jgi:hypothetical protein
MNKMFFIQKREDATAPAKDILNDTSDVVPNLKWQMEN